MKTKAKTLGAILWFRKLGTQLTIPDKLKKLESWHGLVNDSQIVRRISNYQKVLCCLLYRMKEYVSLTLLLITTWHKEMLPHLKIDLKAPLQSPTRRIQFQALTIAQYKAWSKMWEVVWAGQVFMIKQSAPQKWGWGWP